MGDEITCLQQTRGFESTTGLVLGRPSHVLRNKGKTPCGDHVEIGRDRRPFCSKPLENDKA